MPSGGAAAPVVTSGASRRGGARAPLAPAVALPIVFAPVAPAAPVPKHLMKNQEPVCYFPTTVGAKWESVPVVAGTPLTAPTPVFKKLDESIVEEELARLES